MLVPSLEGSLGDLVVFLTIALGIFGIVHAFRIRKEYLVRLDVLQRQGNSDETLLKRRITAEYEPNSQEDSDQSPLSKPDTTNTLMRTPSNDVSNSRPVEREIKQNSQNINTSANVDNTAHPISSNIEHAPKVESDDELEYRISSSYPFPLAFGFRSLMSIVDPRDLYREQLRVAENILAFLGSVSLVVLREQDREETGIDPGEFWRSGISPGDWRDIVGRCSKIFASYEDVPLALAIKGLNIRSEKKGFGAEIISLIRAKNNYKHDRGPVVLEDIVSASEEVQESLRRCMKALAFFAEYPIRQVEDFDVRRRGNGVVLKCLRYTGDHPSFPQEEVVFDNPLPKGDLFIDLGQRCWRPLFPFMTSMTCSRCKARETYFIDMWDMRRNVASMKSFERGHSAINEEVSETLTVWPAESSDDLDSLAQE